MTTTEIEKDYGIHHSSIERAVKRFGLKRDSRLIDKHLRYFSNDTWAGIGKRYLDGESVYSIAKTLGCSASTLGRHLKNLGIKIRDQKVVAREHCKTKNKLPKSKQTLEKMSKIMSKEGNPQWMGGLSYKPYGPEFDEHLRCQIRDRDGHICKMCYEKENGSKLHVHHIDYIKTNNHSANLISLCHHCHGLTNRNREQWIDYFKKEWGKPTCQI